MKWLALIGLGIALTAAATYALFPVLQAHCVFFAVVIWLIGYCLYAFIKDATYHAASERPYHRHTVENVVPIGERGRAQSRSPAVTPKAERAPTGLPKLVLRGGALTDQAVKETTPAQGPTAVITPTFTVRFSGPGIRHTSNGVNYEAMGLTIVPEIRAWLTQHPEHKVVIEPYFDLRLWNLAKRQAQSATPMAYVPQHLRGRVSGLVG